MSDVTDASQINVGDCQPTTPVLTVSAISQEFFQVKVIDNIILEHFTSIHISFLVQVRSSLVQISKPLLLAEFNASLTSRSCELGSIFQHLASAITTGVVDNRIFL